MGDLPPKLRRRWIASVAHAFAAGSRAGSPTDSKRLHTSARTSLPPHCPCIPTGQICALRKVQRGALLALMAAILPRTFAAPRRVVAAWSHRPLRAPPRRAGAPAAHRARADPSASPAPAAPSLPAEPAHSTTTHVSAAHERGCIVAIMLCQPLCSAAGSDSYI